MPGRLAGRTLQIVDGAHFNPSQQPDALIRVKDTGPAPW
jgi:hypothetical protein